jgi:aspartate aminotransferase
MTQLLATRLGAVKPSASIAARARVEALRAAGRRIVDFTLGEPDFPTPSHIIMGGMKALLDGHTRYTASAGTPALRKAIAAKLARENALEFGRDQIVVGCGAKHIIFAALEATLNPDDEVIIPAPYWVSYPDMVALQGAAPVIVPAGAAAAFKLSPEALEKAITPRTRWLILNTPNNPTGAVYSRAELQAICAVLRAHPQVWLLTDEIYEHFTYSGVSHASPLNVAPELASRTLIINGMSKAYAMTGWRVGYGAGPQPLIKAITLLLTQSTTCATASSQAAAVVALEESQDCVRDAVQLFAKRRDCMIDLLNRIPGVHCTRPDGAFYVFPSVEGLIGQKTAAGKTLANDVDVMMYLLDEAGVATIDGTSYGMPGHLRLSFATSIEEIEAGCAAIASAVAACGGTSGPILSNTEQSTDV